MSQPERIYSTDSPSSLNTGGSEDATTNLRTDAVNTMLRDLPAAIAQGAGERLSELKENPAQAGVMIAEGAVIGIGMSILRRNPTALFGAGRFIAQHPVAIPATLLGTDATLRVGVPVADTLLNPSHASANTHKLGYNIGSLAFDLPLMAIGGKAGHDLPTTINSTSETLRSASAAFRSSAFDLSFLNPRSLTPSFATATESGALSTRIVPESLNPPSNILLSSSSRDPFFGLAAELEKRMVPRPDVVAKIITKLDDPDNVLRDLQQVMRLARMDKVDEIAPMKEVATKYGIAPKDAERLISGVRHESITPAFLSWVRAKNNPVQRQAFSNVDDLQADTGFARRSRIYDAMLEEDPWFDGDYPLGD